MCRPRLCVPVCLSPLVSSPSVRHKPRTKRSVNKGKSGLGEAMLGSWHRPVGIVFGGGGGGGWGGIVVGGDGGSDGVVVLVGTVLKVMKVVRGVMILVVGWVGNRGSESQR